MSGEFKHLPVDRPRGSHTGFGATGVNQIPEGGLSPTDVVARALAILAAETGAGTDAASAVACSDALITVPGAPSSSR